MFFDCVCYEDKIFVFDCEGYMIKVYSKDGKFLYEFGGCGIRDGELYYFMGLIVDKIGYFLICFEYSYKI